MSNPRIALVVAAAMVLAVLPAAAAPATGGASDSADAGAATGVLPQQVTADADLRSGETFWQGRQLALDASTLDVNSLAVWRVTEDGQLNQQVTSVQVGENGTAIVDTSRLEGRYVLRAGESPVYVQDGASYTSNAPDGLRVTRDRSTFRVTTQTLSTGWSDPTVYPGQGTTLTIESNRESSVVAVSGGNLSFSALETLIPDSAYASNYDARKNDSTLLIEIGHSTTISLNTAPLAPGDRDLTLDVVDTTARTTPTLTVNEPGEAHIKSIERREHVGDVVDVELACSHCFLVVGGAGQGMLDVVELSDSNGDGNVSLRVNTRYIGMARAQADFPNDVYAYMSPEDSVSRYASSDSLESTEEALITSTVALSDLREELGIRGGGRTSPVEPGTVRLTVSSSDYLLPRWDYGDRPPTGSTLVVKDETDVETVDLTPRSLDGVTAMAAPPESGSAPTAAELRRMVGPRDRVALNDRLVFRVDVSGIYGYLAAHSVDLESIGDNRDEGIQLRLERLAEEGTENPQQLNLGQTAASVVADPAKDDLYLVFKTGGTGRTRLQAGEYRATFTLEGVTAQDDEYSATEAPDGFPYLAAGEESSADATATLAEPVGSIERPAASSGPNRTESGMLEVMGTASVAPGSTVTVVASATEYAWETTATAEVEASGNWSAALNLVEAPGREFDVTLTRDDTQFDSKIYTVYPPAKNTTSEESSSGGEGGSSGNGGAQPAAQGGLTIPVLGIQLPAFSDLAGLAVPVGGGIGGLAVVWISWKLVIKRLLL